MWIAGLAARLRAGGASTLETGLAAALRHRLRPRCEVRERLWSGRRWSAGGQSGGVAAWLESSQVLRLAWPLVPRRLGAARLLWTYSPAPGGARMPALTHGSSSLAVDAIRPTGLPPAAIDRAEARLCP